MVERLRIAGAWLHRPMRPHAGDHFSRCRWGEAADWSHSLWVPVRDSESLQFFETLFLQYRDRRVTAALCISDTRYYRGTSERGSSQQPDLSRADHREF